MNPVTNVAAAIVSACLALAHSATFAQGGAGYPNRLIKIVVPFPAGGATDIMTRNISQKLNEAWKQPVVVENRAGANGMLGADAVVKSQGDGYTYLAATIAHAANVSLFPKAPYQFQRDLRPVAIMGLIPLIPVVRADSPILSLNELVVTSKSKNLNAGSSGNGTAAHLALELFKGMTGAKIQHVPYKGGAPAMTDLLGGQIDVIFALLPEALPHVKSGKLRAIAVTSDQRYPLLPDVPTTSEAGISGIEVTSWNGLMVPAGTPRDIVAKINAEVVRIIGAPDMKARIIEQGFQSVAWGLSETEKFIAGDVARWGKVIREANIKVD
jgi:tripartite-type tricarboxylate transporter receptor subunit TctC